MSIKNFYFTFFRDKTKYISYNLIGDFMENVNLKKYNTYNINCTAKEFYIPKDKDELINILKYIQKNNFKYKILGGGSNVIFENEIYDGVIIKLDNFNKIEIHDNFVSTGSGTNVIKLILTLANKNIGGLEFASSIPGTIGGAIYNNAGAYGKCFADVIEEVTFINSKLETKTIKDCSFDYRTSFFKENKNLIILEAKIKTINKNKEEILQIIKTNKDKRTKSQPLNYPSAGSVFRNPKGLYAGEIIEKLGFKGIKVGDAMVSEKHANFIVNTKNATGKDIVKLINKIQKEAKEKENIELVLEQEIIK